MIVHRNTRHDGKPEISVLTPFFHDDPSAILRVIADAAVRQGAIIEFIVADDGSCDPALTTKVMATIDTLSISAALVTLPSNQGRAATRNVLGSQARGEFLLFLDADVLPDRSDFFTIYYEEILKNRPPILIGGFSVQQCEKSSRTALHYYLTRRLDCQPAKVRNANPWRYCFSCNVLVRADVFADNRFDPAYRGWGWEDQEWGLRISRQHELRHIDNTVSNTGLNCETVLMRKYAESGATFRQILADHPEEMSDSAAYRAYRLLRKVPGHRLAIGPMATLVKARFLPLRLRAFALRSFRALHYVKS